MQMELAIRLKDLNLKVATNYPDYYEYLKKHFNKVISSNSADAKICINIQWNKRPLQIDLEGKGYCIGANTILKDNKIISIRKIGKRKKVKISFALQDKNLTVDAEIYFKPFKDTLRYTLLHSPQESYFFELTYPALYYPAFWYLEHFYNTHALHSSGVKIKDYGVIICGMEGVGKTTLSLLSVKELQARFLSDNLLFYDEDKIYPCYEPVRLHRDTNTQLWEKNFRKIPGFRTLKGFYEPLFDVSQEGVKPALFFLVGFSKDFFVRKVSQERVISKALNFSNLVQELREYNEYGSLLNMLKPDLELYGLRQKRLESLLKNVKCYEVGFDKSIGPLDNFRRLKDLLLL